MFHLLVIIYFFVSQCSSDVHFWFVCLTLFLLCVAFSKNQFFFHVPLALLLTLLLFLHYYFLHVVVLLVLLFITHCCSSCIAPLMLHISCCSFHAIVFMPLLLHYNFAPLTLRLLRCSSHVPCTLLLLHCSSCITVMCYFLRITIPFPLPSFLLLLLLHISITY